MPTPIITIDYVTLWDDARANTWKTGRIAPREDGLHTEEQMSDAAMDKRIACRFFLEGTYHVMNITKDFRAVDISTTPGNNNCYSRYEGNSYPQSFRPVPIAPYSDDSGIGSDISQPYSIYYALDVYENPAAHSGENAYTLVDIKLSKINARANATNAELSALAHEYVLAYTMREWYKMVDPSRMASWERRRADAELRILRACRYKQKLN